jgi:hypothetical protein
MELGDCTVGNWDPIRTRYRRRRFSTSSQEIRRSDDIHWPINEDTLIDYYPHARMPSNHKAHLSVICLHGASELQISWSLQRSDKIGRQLSHDLCSRAALGQLDAGF